MPDRKGNQIKVIRPCCLLGRRPKRRPGRQKLPFWAIFAAVALLPAASGAESAESSAAVALTPHSAHYGVALKSARSGSSIQSAHGDMIVSWEGDCAGWTMTYRLVFDVGYTGGRVVRISVDAATWEARNGGRYNFTSRTSFDDREAERVEGHAVRTPELNEAHFTSPTRKTIALPSDTIFPTRHTEMILEAARAGRRIVPATLFDGFAPDGAQFVNAVIGPEIPAEPGSAKAFADLARHPMWRVRLAFFDGDAQRTEPASEVGMDLYANGVTARLDLDFGDFAIRSALQKLELIPRPVCRD